MQAAVGLFSRAGIRVVACCSISLALTLLISEVQANEVLSEISAHKFRAGCRIVFEKEIMIDPTDHMSDPPYAIHAKWVCRGAKGVRFDTYDIQGGSPNIGGVVFGEKKKTMVVLISWSVNSRAADVQGEYYRPYAYRASGSLLKPLVRNRRLMKELGSGWVGNDRGREVAFALSNPVAIQEALSKLGY
jgi:hypothetical protein